MGLRGRTQALLTKVIPLHYPYFKILNMVMVIIYVAEIHSPVKNNKMLGDYTSQLTITRILKKNTVKRVKLQ